MAAAHLAVPLTPGGRVLEDLADDVVKVLGGLLRVALWLLVTWKRVWSARFVRVFVGLLLAGNTLLAVCALSRYGHDGWAMSLFAAAVLVPAFVKAWLEMGSA